MIWGFERRPGEVAVDPDASVEDILDAAGAERERAVATGDAAALERLAATLEEGARARGDEGRGLLVSAARARAALAQLTGVPAAPAVAVVEYASWGRRATAMLVDWFVIGLVVAAWLGRLGLLFVAAVLVAYFTLLHGTSGRTLGKLALGIAVRRSDGSAVDLGRALLRSLAQVVPLFLAPVFIVDSLWPLWDGRSQTLHDKAADTVVVRVRG